MMIHRKGAEGAKNVRQDKQDIIFFRLSTCPPPARSCLAVADGSRAAQARRAGEKGQNLNPSSRERKGPGTRARGWTWLIL